jgi:hypothetical protein
LKIASEKRYCEYDSAYNDSGIGDIINPSNDQAAQNIATFGSFFAL